MYAMDANDHVNVFIPAPIAGATYTMYNMITS
jgi:hypothetical protein